MTFVAVKKHPLEICFWCKHAPCECPKHSVNLVPYEPTEEKEKPQCET